MTTHSRQFEFIRMMPTISVGLDRIPTRLIFGPEYADWLYVCWFQHGDPFGEANLNAIRKALLQTCSERVFHLGVLQDVNNRALFSFLIIRDFPDAMAVTAGLMATHEAGDHIDEESYWRVADVHLQRMWAGLSVPERLSYVMRTDAPTDIVLEPYVSQEIHPDLWVLLYQDMGL